MPTLFSTIAFFALIAAAAAWIVWAVNRARRRETRAKFVTLGAAILAVACFVAFGLTYEPPEKPAQAGQEPAVSAAEPEEATDTTQTTDAATEPTEAPAAASQVPAAITPEPSANQEPVQSAEPTPEPDPVELDKEEIEAAARDIVVQNYTMTDVEQVTINENSGTEEDGDYVLLITLTWNVKNSEEMTKKMLAMYSEDFAARIGADVPKVNDLAVFWIVPYYSETDTAAKYSYLRGDGGMYEDGHIVTLPQN